jgi:hypothetical protein
MKPSTRPSKLEQNLNMKLKPSARSTPAPLLFAADVRDGHAPTPENMRAVSSPHAPRPSWHQSLKQVSAFFLLSNPTEKYTQIEKRGYLYVRDDRRKRLALTAALVCLLLFGVLAPLFVRSETATWIQKHLRIPLGLLESLAVETTVLRYWNWLLHSDIYLVMGARDSKGEAGGP